MYSYLFDEEYLREQYDIAARRESWEEGIAEGIAEGFAKGIAEGIAEGIRINEERESLKRKLLLSGFTDEQIADILR